MRNAVRGLLFLVVLGVVMGSGGPARAGEVEVRAGLAGAATDWKSDGAGVGSLTIGFRFIDLVGVYIFGRLGYGAVDDRMLTCLGFGGQIWGRLGIVRPYARLGLLHIHEEPWTAFVNQPIGALLGVGDGIRHRTGLELGLGLDIPVWKKNKWELFMGVEANAAWVTFSSGPSWYWGGGLSFGFHFST